jgi:hypothetical protein
VVEDDEVLAPAASAPAGDERDLVVVMGVDPSRDNRGRSAPPHAGHEPANFEYFADILDVDDFGAPEGDAIDMRVDRERGPSDARSDPGDRYDCLRSRFGGQHDSKERAGDEPDVNVVAMIRGKSRFMSLPNFIRRTGVGTGSNFLTDAEHGKCLSFRNVTVKPNG